jgi:arylsulfatase
MAMQKGKYKLVGKTDYNAPIESFELFNIKEDPYEQNNLINSNKSIATDLKEALDQVFKTLISSDNLNNPPRLVVGSDHENPVILNRNDADGERGIWAQEEIFGNWKVSVREGHYNFKFKFIRPLAENGIMYLETKPFINQMRNTTSDADIIEMKNVYLPKMDCDLIPFYATGSKRIFPFYVEVERIDE